MEIADRISVFRDGQNIITLNKKDTNEAEIVRHMIGRTIENYFNKVKAPVGEEVMRVVFTAGY